MCDNTNIEDSIVNTIKKKKKNKNPRCELVECNKHQSIIIGSCKWCNLHFCNIHRLPESHTCCKINDCKNMAFDINKNKLQNEKTVSKKVIAI